MRHIAIDPGKSGGVAWVEKWNHGKQTVNCVSMPETEGDIITLFRKILFHRAEDEKYTLYMEKLSGFAGGPGNPGSTMFTMAKYYWSWIFLAMYNNIRVELVAPQKWQKEIGLGTKGTFKGMTKPQAYAIKRDWKNKLKAKAQQLFPEQKVTLKTSDALLILEYARRQNTLPF